MLPPAALRPLLFGVLRRLARQGYVTSAARGFDLVHDFLAEVWPGLAERLEPAQGSLERQAAVAFVRFVRPRLVREARWAVMLGDDEPAADHVPAEPAAEEVAAIRDALHALDGRDRELLRARFGASAASERTLAREAGLGRYRLRERLAGALGRLAVALGEGGGVPPSSAAVARRVFADGVSVVRTASELALPEPHVRATRRRILRALGRASGEASA